MARSIFQELEEEVPAGDLPPGRRPTAGTWQNSAGRWISVRTPSISWSVRKCSPGRVMLDKADLEDLPPDHAQALRRCPRPIQALLSQGIPLLPHRPKQHHAAGGGEQAAAVPRPSPCKQLVFSREGLVHSMLLGLTPFHTSPSPLHRQGRPLNRGSHCGHDSRNGLPGPEAYP